MAKKKKSGAPKPAGSQAQPAGGSTSKVDAQAPAPAKPAPAKDVDHRPETSPYGSAPCTIPFAKPLSVPLDLLKKYPKLHAAYENRLPELSTIPEAVGHVLIHYIHTGKYEALKPKATDAMTKQICELKTSIQAYAAARSYDMPGLMRLAENQINKHGEGLPLPALLEVARDAYPTLTEADGWFLDYLRSRIRPLLRPESLLSSELLDQISSILSPHKLLLKTVLELFCERIAAPPEPAASLRTSTVASPVTSPESAQATSFSPASPLSLLEMRSRSILRDGNHTPRKNLKTTPWPSPDTMSEASRTRETSVEPVLRAQEPPARAATPMIERAPATAALPEAGTVIIDVAPPPEPSVEANADVRTGNADAAPEPGVVANGTSERDVDVKAEPEVSAPVEPGPVADADVALQSAGEPETDRKPEHEELPEQSAPVAPRERKDSGKEIDLEPVQRELGLARGAVPETELKPGSSLQVQRGTMREADSGFWEGPDVEPEKESPPALVELGPEAASTPKPETAGEPESVAPSDGIPEVAACDFAASDGAIQTQTESKPDAEPEAPEDPGSVILPKAQAPAGETVPENSTRDEVDHGSDPKPEPLPIRSVADDGEQPANLAAAMSESVLVPGPEDSQIEEVEAKPVSEKVQAEKPLQAEAATEPLQADAAAKPEPEPKTDSTTVVPVPDNAQPAGASEPEAAQPGREPEPEPAGKAEEQRVNTDSAVHAAPASAGERPAVLSAKPAPEQEGAKTEANGAGDQACSSPVRHRSWKRRFLSLRYPTLFGRDM
ncbi:48d9c28b-5971-4a8e-a11b-9381589fda27 [Thermothielavioides terrestris]|uniref:48d9c28b-5971-4a8e-a11b-9381589fda27 n=1 Tax=Thermothielavioides terrestris TaxID=2587410 RepID=A0A446BR75_9PEZI|nr:48d9c28b-5971-4a8e-a11b-9381589fda27 [Thermothielavioides terrestris]